MCEHKPVDPERLVFPEQTEVRIEWAAKWSDGGYCPSPRPHDEEWARQHARMFGTTVIKRTVSPWEVAD